MRSLFKRKKKTGVGFIKGKIDKYESNDFEKELLINIDGSNISTGMVGGYLLKLRKLGMIHLGYKFIKIEGLSRVNIYSAVPVPIRTKMYFEDRCPAIVEQEIKESEPMPHSFLVWKNGFREVTEYGN